jgi:hypothetical protein
MLNPWFTTLDKHGFWRILGTVHDRHRWYSSESKLHLTYVSESRPILSGLFPNWGKLFQMYIYIIIYIYLIIIYIYTIHSVDDLI